MRALLPALLCSTAGLLAQSAFSPTDPALATGTDGNVRIMLMGPYTIPAGRMIGTTLVPGNYEPTFPVSAPNPGDVWMTGYDSRIVDLNRVPQDPQLLYLHHAVLVRQGAPDLTCSTIALLNSERFAAAGAERIPFSLPAGHGYRIKGTDTLLGLMHIQNFTLTQRTVYYEFTMTVQPGTLAMTAVRPWWLDVVNCTSSYTVPTGTGQHVKSLDYNTAQKMTVLSMGPHLHCGGMKLELFDRTNGNALIKGFANYGVNLCPVQMDSVLPNPPVVLNQGTVVTLKATYQQDPVKSWDAMGILLAYVIIG